MFIRFALLVFLSIAFNFSFAQVVTKQYSAGGLHLTVELLDDDLIHVEYAQQQNIGAIYTSPMVYKTDYAGPAFVQDLGSQINTNDLRLEVNGSSLCVTFKDRNKSDALLTTLCPADFNLDWKGLNIDPASTENIYGLGQQFKVLGSADGDWLSHGVREAQPNWQAQSHGNGFMPFGQAGMVGNVQFPVMYALGSNNLQYALFLDNVYKRQWDFNANWWQVRMWGDQIRFYFMAGNDLPDLRSDYMELTGRPPVPPKKSFGLWVSEFGYKDWNQVDDLKNSLRADDFPLDGFVLDLFWFGGIKVNNPDSAMGRLDWDENNLDGNDYYFPNPASKVSQLAADHIGLVAIEESYFNLNTDSYSQMQSAGDFFAYGRANGVCNPANYQPITLSDWFGYAAMMDWSDSVGAKWIHDNRRFPNLSDIGITGHWTDLGEPEKYDEFACYDGVETTASGIKNTHGDIHNLYSFLWAESIYDGYYDKRSQVDDRPFIMTRSGAPGVQRFGASLWSGDIGSHLDLLATHSNSQLHMSFSGIDYYGADVGGFRREGIPYNGNHSGERQYEDELYTQWFANAAWFDVPVRPHTDNAFQTSQDYETSPHAVGNKASNLENIRRRYELAPYYYSLAHLAYLYGEPLIPPLVFYYQNDPVVRTMGHQKLIGKDLMVALVASHGEYQRDVYLPLGEWVDWHSNEWKTSTGQWIANVPVYRGGKFTLPAYAKAGAIIPMMTVTPETKDIFGNLKSGGQSSELKAKIFLSSTATSFNVFDDDGATLSYQTDKSPSYQTQVTQLSQVFNASSQDAQITIAAAVGNYGGAPVTRNNHLVLISDDLVASTVKVNGVNLVQYYTLASFESANAGWMNTAHNQVEIKTGNLSVSMSKTIDVSFSNGVAQTSINFVCDNGWTNLGEDIYVTGNIPELGGWNPNQGIKLSPSVYKEYIYNPPSNHNGPGPSEPVWTELIHGLPVNTQVQWKCIKKLNNGFYLWQPGSNSTIQTSGGGYSGMSYGKF